MKKKVVAQISRKDYAISLLMESACVAGGIFLAHFIGNSYRSFAVTQQNFEDIAAELAKMSKD